MSAGTAGRFRTWDPDQRCLLPLSLEQCLPENHLARCLAAVVGILGLSKILA